MRALTGMWRAVKISPLGNREKRTRVFGNVFRRIAALPFAAKALLVVAALIVLGLSVVLSPLVAILALLVLIVAVVALVLRVLRRRPLRNWGLVALASLLFLIVFSGITNALYGGGAPQQASSPAEPKEEAERETPVEEVEQQAAVEEADHPEKEADFLPASSSSSEPAAEAQDDRGGYDATVRVTRVVDGDTIEISPAVDGKDEVRLIGMDTPETKEPGCAVQPYGPEASEFTTRGLQGEEVGLEFDQDREDRYGRLLAYVHDDGEMFNETLLEEGYAQVYTVPPNDRYVDRFGEAQEEARVTGRGIWALPADQLSQLDDRGNGIGGGGCTQKAQPEAPPKQQPQPAPEPPPDLDAPDAPAPAAAGSALRLPGGDCPESAPIKGNRTSSSGDLIYHVRGGQFYEKTKAEECFANASEAEAAGYRASKR